MGFAPDLDLSDFIADYEPFFDGGGPVLPRGAVTINDSPGHQHESHILSLSSTLKPVRFGMGPDTVSTCTALAVVPEIIWDVNGYYRELGVPTNATRKELRLAFQRLDGHSSDRLTYIMGQLLNAETRREYDCTPLGQPYMDRYVQDGFKRAAKREADRRNAQGDKITAREVLDEMGLKIEDEESPDPVDNEEQVGQHGAEEPAGYVDPWEYSYYLWRSISPEEDRLQQWQELLHREAVASRVVIQFAVGYRGGSDVPDWSVTTVGDAHVAFLNERVKPTRAHALAALSQLSQAALGTDSS